MALPSSGAISMSQVNTELGLSSSATVSLNDDRVRLLANVPTGAIAMSNLYGKQRPTLSWTATGTPSGTAANQTYSNLSIGAAASNRIIIVAVAGVSGTGGRPIYDVTINGTYMTEIQSVYTNNSGTASSAIYCIAWPTGTTATFVCYTGGNQSPVPYILATYGLNSATPYATNAIISPGTNVNLQRTLAQEYDGLTVGIGSTRASSGTSWTGLTERTPGSTKNLAYDTNNTRTLATITFNDNSSTGSMCIASWR